MLETKLKNLKPAYLRRFEDLIKLHAQFGGGASSEKYIQAKSFSNVYEFYIYAYFLGIKKAKKFEVLESDDTNTFWEILNWKPTDLVDCLLSSAIAESGLDLAKMEQMEESEIVVSVKSIRSNIEAYANGGFDVISRTADEDPEAASDDRFFINLLGQE
jgi:hypothetical protein